jgi:hypothetical protein
LSSASPREAEQVLSLPGALQDFADGPDPEAPLAGLIRARRYAGLITIDAMVVGFVSFGILDAPWWLTGHDPVAPAVIVGVLASLVRFVVLYQRYRPRWADWPY